MIRAISVAESLVDPIGRTQLHQRPNPSVYDRDSPWQVAMLAFTPAGQQIVYLRLHHELPAPSQPVAVSAVALETLYGSFA